ncbi:ABC transporter ATP-binding protein [Pectobacterium aquaticum]|uniref:ABC transporter ATP-binding protein n=1 Tax=Pectobacterium aquaticum TaxID=2204145 RepID=UPI000E267382|nr:ABC transporter ATP-binding protein [Pectobacterium aquaticum]UEM39845.1 ABC transporter ATP-binding protein/permease [Pectobacterium aquaticum]
MKQLSYPRFPYFSLSDFSIHQLTVFFRERMQLLKLFASGGTLFILAAAAMIAAGGIISVLLPGFAHQVVADMTSNSESKPVFYSVLYLSLALFSLQALEIVRSYIGKIAAKRIDGTIRMQVRNIILSVRGMEQLEQAEFQQMVEKASDQGLTWRIRSAGTAAIGQLQLIARIVSVLGMAFALAHYFPLLAGFLFISTSFLRAVGLRQWLFLEKFKDDRLSEKRKVDYWSALATTPEPAKEIRIFGLSGWVSEKRKAAHLMWLSDYWRVRRKILNNQVFPAALAVINGIAALYIPGASAFNGEISNADLAACLVAAWGIFKMATIGGEAYDIEYGRTAITALDTLKASIYPEPDSGVSVDNSLPDIVFRNISFKYPNSPNAIFENFNLHIKPRERIAIVGSNGVGKTTLIKLLAGLYLPDSGEILINGKDIRELNISSWRKRMSVLFQDFIRYPLSIRENITASAPGEISTDDELMELLTRCGAAEVVRKNDRGLDTEVWRTGMQGNDLSGGEWQKLALTRVIYAAFHGRKVIILDEPTAHMDVHADVEFFDRVNRLAGDSTVIIISHRLSTVRFADRIILLNNGVVAEQGNHEQLMFQNGAYANLFNLQASRFEEK